MAIENALFAFHDRRDAGSRLAGAVATRGGLTDPIVLALPRGGVPIGYEVARRLGAPLDVLVVRKLGMPWQEELAIGAIASGGASVINWDLVREAGLRRDLIDRIRRREQAELERRARDYRGDRPFPRLEGRSVIVVDDGAATGASILAALAALRSERPRELVVAVPVAPAETFRRLSGAASRVICLLVPPAFWAIGDWYADFAQVTDAEVRSLLARSQSERASPGNPVAAPGVLRT
jgi:predicted phosphoribosyltransferase